MEGTVLGIEDTSHRKGDELCLWWVKGMMVGCMATATQSEISTSRTESFTLDINGGLHSQLRNPV